MSSAQRLSRREESTVKSPPAPERQLLDEISGIAARLKTLRGDARSMNIDLIKALEQQSRTKWNELRLLRAGPSPLDEQELRSRSLYR
jgi:hypothetical protein